MVVKTRAAIAQILHVGEVSHSRLELGLDGGPLVERSGTTGTEYQEYAPRRAREKRTITHGATPTRLVVAEQPSMRDSSPSLMTRHLYVHIPFCPKVCPYCSFYKEASDRNKTQGF